METAHSIQKSNGSHSVSFETMPSYIGLILQEIESLKGLISHPQESTPLSKYVDINGAAKITSKTPNALRVQISLGNLKSIKKGSRNYFEREYLENWISGEVEFENHKKGRK